MLDVITGLCLETRDAEEESLSLSLNPVIPGAKTEHVERV